MEESANKQSHSFGNGQQRNHHPRPFFYVQPPSQPYYMYQQWQLNNPYTQYAVPAGLNFSRPCILPYQYVQYPSFVFPHAPIYPVDYRRIFEPRFHTPTWGDMPRQQQHHHPPPQQPQGHRETACSEAQTDPSDTITKLIECLDKFRASDLQKSTSRGRELDSGVASQSSGMFSPEEKKNEEQSRVLPLAPHDSHLENPAVTFGESPAASYESSQMMLTPQVCWSGGLEEALPIDSSSVHEECPELEGSTLDEHFIPFEKEKVLDIESDISVTNPNVPRCDAEESRNSISFSSTEAMPKEAKNIQASKVELLATSFDETKSDQSYQILKLPLDSVLTPGSAGAGCLSSPSAPYYYNYLSMQTTHERMSVLSPSLDELSSRDEMFSTDLDDVDLFPKHVYAGGKLAEVISGSSHQAAEEEEVWLPGSKRIVCACCGKRLAKETSQSKVHISKMYQDEAGDSEEDSRYGRGCEQPVRLAARKHVTPRKPHQLPVRPAAKPWNKRGQYKEHSNPADLEDVREVCKQETTEGDTGEMEGSELQCRTCQDRLCKEELTTSDKGRWADSNVIPRRRQAAALQGQVTELQSRHSDKTRSTETSLLQQKNTGTSDMSSQWKVMYHGPRDEHHNDEELPPIHWERVSLMRGESRC